PGQRGNLRLRMLLFDQAMKDGDEEGMKQTLEGIRSVEQNSGTYYQYGQALLLIWKGRRAGEGEERRALLAKAPQELARVLSQRASWPPVFKARAEIAELNGNPELAIKELEEAVKTGDSSLGTIQRLAILLTDRGHTERATAMIERLQGAMRANTDL